MSYDQLRKIIGTDSQTAVYFSLPPECYPSALTGLSTAGLLDSISIVVTEKPLAPTLAQGQKFLELLQQQGKESLVAFVEHFLLKETLQNILAFRLSTPFEQLFNRDNVAEIKIYALEKLTAKDRPAFYESVGGALPDMITHLLAIAYPFLIDLPTSLNIQDIRKAKENVARALRVTDIPKAVFGQYNGYRQECNNPSSQTMTFIGFTVEYPNPRWQGVPVKIVTGKGLPDKYCGVEIVFKQHSNACRMFPSATQPVLVFRHHPKEGISFHFDIKQPGVGMQIQTVKMEFTYSALNQVNQPAYLRLLSDIMAGDLSWFSGPVEAIEALRVADDLQVGRVPSLVNYEVGTYPTEAKDWLPTEVQGWL